jgi:hypothetical protein
VYKCVFMYILYISQRTLQQLQSVTALAAVVYRL